MHELARFDKGLLAVVFDTSDRIQHMTPQNDDVASSAIGTYLIEFDRFLGGVLAKLPQNTPLIIFSDHGFARFDYSVDVNRWLIDNGYMTIDEKAYAQRSADDSGELFKYVDWQQTKAYAVGFAGIYLNMQGREGKGIVAAAQRTTLSEEIATKLTALSDTVGQRAVHHVYRREQLYNGALTTRAPDLVIGFNNGFRGSWQSAVGGLNDEIIAKNDKLWQRDHIIDPSFVEATLITNFEVGTEVHAYDLAPTVLTLLGVDVPDAIEGRSWFQNSSNEVAQAE
jgi:predicted AlkP superfamily phosphohydrolase/phosphomutase